MFREYLAKRRHVKELLNAVTVVQTPDGKLVFARTDWETYRSIRDALASRPRDAGGYYNNFDPRDFPDEEREIKEATIPTAASRLATTLANEAK